MSYYFNTVVRGKNFEDTIEQVSTELQKEGFGVLTKIDIKNTLKSKLDVDFKNYIILGACNPHFAYKALQNEDKIGVLLPCNIIVEEHENGDIEVSAVDPIASMGAVENENLGSLASDVQKKLINVIAALD